MNGKVLGVLMGAAIVLSGVLIACSDDEPSEDEARRQLCDDLNQLELQIDSIASISAESTVGELRSAREDLQTAVEDVRSSAEDVEEADAAGIDSAFEDLTTAVDELDENLTLSAALEEIQPELDAIEQARSELFTDTSCEDLPTPTAAAATEVPPTPTTEPGTTPTGALRTVEAATAEAAAGLTATVEAAIPEVKTAIVGTAVAQTAVAGTSVAGTAVAATATIEAAVPEVKTAIVGTAIAAQTATAEANATNTAIPQVNPQ